MAVDYSNPIAKGNYVVCKGEHSTGIFNIFPLFLLSGGGYLHILIFLYQIIREKSIYGKYHKKFPHFGRKSNLQHQIQAIESDLCCIDSPKR